MPAVAGRSRTGTCRRAHKFASALVRKTKGSQCCPIGCSAQRPACARSPHVRRSARGRSRDAPSARCRSTKARRPRRSRPSSAFYYIDGMSVAGPEWGGSPPPANTCVACINFSVRKGTADAVARRHTDRSDARCVAVRSEGRAPPARRRATRSTAPDEVHGPPSTCPGSPAVRAGSGRSAGPCSRSLQLGSGERRSSPPRPLPSEAEPGAVDGSRESLERRGQLPQLKQSAAFDGEGADCRAEGEVLARRVGKHRAEQQGRVEMDPLDAPPDRLADEAADAGEGEVPKSAATILERPLAALAEHPRNRWRELRRPEARGGAMDLDCRNPEGPLESAGLITSSSRRAPISSARASRPSSRSSRIGERRRRRAAFRIRIDVSRSGLGNGDGCSGARCWPRTSRTKSKSGCWSRAARASLRAARKGLAKRD